MLQQSERVPQHYQLAATPRGSKSASLLLHSDDDVVHLPFDFSFEVVRDNVFRTTFSSDVHPIPPYPSVPRLESACSELNVITETNKRTIKTASATAVVEWSNAPVVSLFLDGVQKPIHRDLHFRSYAVDDTGIAHYSAYKKDTLHVGLGEKAAPMNLAGRSLAVSASDTFGYDAYLTDPLYIHIPLLINVTPQGCVGIFSTAHSRAHWAVGSEIDGMWGHYKKYQQAHGGLEEYLIVGKTMEQVVQSFAQLAGFPLLVPRYMFGYISGGMKYSMEHGDAVLRFLDKCAQHDIPVSAHQLSSGYTVSETPPKTRNVFTWNHRTFPDPRGFTKQCHRRGVRLLGNVKPYILANHPAYEHLHKSGAFFRDPATKSSALARLWSAGGGESGEGSHIDFTSRAGCDFWYEGCRALREVGIDGIWNDNNEYNIPNDNWECALENTSAPAGEDRKYIGLWGRALHTELMAKGSHDACVDVEPDERPLVLTRSATAGTLRFASCSWSGDNVTSWQDMKGGNALALNAGFSLIQCYGHDIGGFEGPQPSPELLVRWVQLGIHSPRFAINCYKTSPEDNLVGEVIEPFMYPSVTPMIRAAIKRRYELIPYTYSLMLKSHLTAVPPQRWTGWGYESDPEVWTRAITAGDQQYWFGDALLVAGVYEPGKDSARVYLPQKLETRTDFGFLNTNAPFQHLASGRWHDISSTWHSSIPVLARCGSAVPVGLCKPTTCRADADSRAEQDEFPGVAKDDWRGVEIFPPPVVLGEGTVAASHTTCSFRCTWLEDDGIGRAGKAGLCHVHLTYSLRNAPDTAIAVKVHVVKEGEWEPLWLPGGVDVILPVGEERVVETMDGPSTVTSKGLDSRGRRVWNVSVDGVDAAPEVGV